MSIYSLLLAAVLALPVGAHNLLQAPIVLPERYYQLAAAPPKQQFCDDPKLRYCQVTFNADLGITGDADWKNPRLLGEQITKLVSQGVDGLLRVCKARTQFYRCLGPYYDMCITRYYFIEKGLTRDDAEAYVQLFKQLEFMCNGGLLQVLQKFDCILHTDEQVTSAINNCTIAYVTTVSADPTKTCDAAEILLTCVRLPMFSACGRDAGWWECEMMRLVLEIDQFCSHLMCTYASIIPRSSKANHNRMHIFGSDNPFFMSQAKQSLFASLGSKAEERMRRRKREIEY